LAVYDRRTNRLASATPSPSVLLSAAQPTRQAHRFSSVVLSGWRTWRSTSHAAPDVAAGGSSSSCVRRHDEAFPRKRSVRPLASRRSCPATGPYPGPPSESASQPRRESATAAKASSLNTPRTTPDRRRKTVRVGQGPNAASSRKPNDHGSRNIPGR